jgi:hypothetical protein
MIDSMIICISRMHRRRSSRRHRRHKGRDGKHPPFAGQLEQCESGENAKRRRDAEFSTTSRRVGVSIALAAAAGTRPERRRTRGLFILVAALLLWCKTITSIRDHGDVLLWNAGQRPAACPPATTSRTAETDQTSPQNSTKNMSSMMPIDIHPRKCVGLG